MPALTRPILGLMPTALRRAVIARPSSLRAARTFSSTLVHRAHPPKPGSTAKATSTHGQAISEDAKEDERTKSGVSEEPSRGAKHIPLAQRSTPSLFSLEGQTVIVTGGGRGLGLTIAQAVLEAGGHVAAVDLLPDPTPDEWAHAQEIATTNNLSLSYTNLDVTDRDAVHKTFNEIFDRAPPHAPVKGLFCSAGIQMLVPALEYTPEQIRKIIDVNLTGTFLCAQAFASGFKARNPGPGRRETASPLQQDASGRPGVEPVSGLAGEGGGSIVMTGSMSGHVANFGLECAAYNASKAGVNQLAKNFAMEWGKLGIRVNSLSPGYIRTAMTRALLDQKPELGEIWLRNALLGRLSTQDEYRGPVVFLLSDASSFVTGADLLVDGGHTAT